MNPELLIAGLTFAAIYLIGKLLPKLILVVMVLGIGFLFLNGKTELFNNIIDKIVESIQIVFEHVCLFVGKLL